MDHTQAKTKFKILMLVRYYHPHIGGNEHQCQLLSEYLASNNLKVTVITERYSRKLLKNELLNEVEIIRLNSLNTIFNVNRIKSRNILVRVFRYIFYFSAEFSLMFNIFFYLRFRKVKDEILQIHQNNWLAFWGILGCKKRMPVLIKDATLNNFSELKRMPLSNYMKRRIIKDGQFIAISRDIRQNLLSNGISEDRIYFIPNGVKIPEETNKYANTQDIIFVGNFNQGKIKNLEMLIKAFNEAFKQNITPRLLIIGKGEKEPYLRLIEKYPLIKNRIVFLGQFDNVDQYYINSFIYVLPSESEGMSNSLLEAMSYGMPCISTKVSGSNDLIVHNQNGILVDIYNDKQLTESILYLMSNNEIAYQLGRNARMTIVSDYQIKSIAEKYLKLYNQIEDEWLQAIR